MSNNRLMCDFDQEETGHLFRDEVNNEEGKAGGISLWLAYAKNPFCDMP